MSDSTNMRPNKGRSLLAFPSDYTVVDIETTGLDPRRNEIIELSAVRVRGCEVSDHYSTLVKPVEEISSFITQLTGITNADLSDAPQITDILPDFLRFIGSDVVVGHNAHFDVNFIYDAATTTGSGCFSNDIVDTMRLSRHALPTLKHHRLSDVADALGVIPEGAHRGLADCFTTHAVLQALRSVSDLLGIDFVSTASRSYRAADISAQPGMLHPDHPLYGKVCVFTGTLERMPRRDAMQLVVNLGGSCGDNVTTKTNYLILGNNEYCTTIKDGKSSKQKKAEGLILKGQELQILSESVFYDMIDSLVPPGLGDKKEPPRKVAAYGCCSRYEQCSDARECVHPDPTFALGCSYRKNLLDRKIFYGKNRNIK